MANSKYKAMTVNERLYVSGLIYEFDKAVEEKNVKKAIDILKEVELTELSIIPILLQLHLIDESQSISDCI